VKQIQIGSEEPSPDEDVESRFSGGDDQKSADVGDDVALAKARDNHEEWGEERTDDLMPMHTIKRSRLNIASAQRWTCEKDNEEYEEENYEADLNDRRAGADSAASAAQKEQRQGEGEGEEEEGEHDMHGKPAAARSSSCQASVDGSDAPPVVENAPQACGWVAYMETSEDEDAYESSSTEDEEDDDSRSTEDTEDEEDDDSRSNGRIERRIFGVPFHKYYKLAGILNKRYNSALATSDANGMAFYGHLLSYVAMYSKDRSNDYYLGAYEKNIKKLIRRFDDKTNKLANAKTEEFKALLMEKQWCILESAKTELPLEGRP
jgi:hypothetical protein